MARPKALLLVLSGIALCAPFALVAKAQGTLVESAVAAVVSALSSVTAPLAVASEPPGALEDPELDVMDASSDVTALVTAAGKAKARPARAAAPAKPTALFVSATTVLGLSKSAARPRGSFVPQTPQHPAGLRLVGVDALGIGVQDGDILIDAMGLTPRSSGEIIGAIIEARARRARQLSGMLWRRGQTFRITVEQPYVGPA